MLAERMEHVLRPCTVLIVLMLIVIAWPGPAAMSMRPPSVSYPAIYKTLGGETLFGLNDKVEFTVIVGNELDPSPPLQPQTWYNVRATDVLSPSLVIDTVEVRGSYDDYSVTGNTVVVTATTLAPGDWYAFDIHCTIASIPQPEPVITNTARLDFAYEGGEPEGSLISDPVVVTVLRRSFLPIVLVNP